MDKIRLFSLLSSFVIAGIALSGCSMFSDKEDKAPLAGERISVLDMDQKLFGAADKTDSAIAITIDQGVKNESWPVAGGTPTHVMGNLLVGDGQTLDKIWQVSIGSGGSDRIPLNAKPVIAEGKVFTLDAKNNLRAFHNQTGKLQWEQSVKHPKEKDSVINGGLAYDNGVLYVTSGYNEVLAVKAADGSIIWRTVLSSGSRAAPAVSQGQIYVTTLSNHLIALNTNDGQILWEFEGTEETAGLLGAASAATEGQIVIPAFSNGDLMALRVENGSIVWEDSLANSLRLGGLAGLSDIRGLPVIASDRVIATSFGGRTIAFDKLSGSRLWQQNVGSSETPWVSGNTVFLLDTQSRVIALNIESGQPIWTTQLQRYGDKKAHSHPIIWTGPVMMNGRLLIAGSKGRMQEINPANGEVVHSWSTEQSSSLTPIIADGALYILSDNGTLSAYR